MVRLVSGSPAGHLALSSPYTWRFDSSSPRSKLLALESGKVPEQEGGVRASSSFWFILSGQKMLLRAHSLSVFFEASTTSLRR